MASSLIFRMGTDTAGLRKDLDAAGRHVKQWAGSIKSSIAASASGALGGIISIGAVVGVGKAVLDFAGNLADASDALGINVEALQELQGAFAKSGAGAEVVSKGIGKLSENLTAAKNGSAPMVASFAALGVTWEDIQTLAPDEVLMKLAASAGSAKDPAERLSLIMEVMGKSGLKMAAGLNGGVAALKELRGEVSKLTTGEIADLDAAGDALTGLGNKAKVAAAQAILGAKALLQGDGKSSIWQRVGKMAESGLVSGVANEAMGAIQAKGDARMREKAVGLLDKARGQHAAKNQGMAMSPEDVASLRAFEKAQSDEQKGILELREWERQQYVQFLGLKEDADEKSIKELRDFEKDQYEDFLSHKKTKDEADAAAVKQRIADELAARKDAIDKEANHRQTALQKFIATAGDPHAAANARKQANEERKHTAAFKRGEARDARGGKASADAPQPFGPVAPLSLGKRDIFSDLRKSTGNPSVELPKPETIAPILQKIETNTQLLKSVGKCH